VEQSDSKDSVMMRWKKRVTYHGCLVGGIGLAGSHHIELTTMPGENRELRILKTANGENCGVTEVVSQWCHIGVTVVIQLCLVWLFIASSLQPCHVKIANFVFLKLYVVSRFIILPLLAVSVCVCVCV
jgi:hypothetical protein